jgi:hypothetical protein
VHHSPISSKRTIRIHVVGKQTANHRLERSVTGGGAPRARFAILLSRRAGRVCVRPLKLIFRPLLDV